MENNTLELPKFRYVDDAVRYLDDTEQSITDLEGLVKVRQAQLAKLERPEKWIQKTRSVGQLKTKVSAKFRLSADLAEPVKHVAPNIKKLEKSYALSEDLHEKYRCLEALETQLAVQFQDINQKSVKETLSRVKLLKNKLEVLLGDLLHSLNNVADKHVPAEFQKYMDAISQVVKEKVAPETSQLFLYASLKDGNLVFTYYLMMNNVVGDNDKEVPSLCVSVQWVVGSSVHVQVSPDFELPAQLMSNPGVEVNAVGEAIKEVEALISAQGL